MFRYFIILTFSSIYLFANELENLDLTYSWLGFTVLFIFIIGYYFIANEEKYKLDKAIPALVIGVSSFLLISVYYYINDLDINLVHNELEKVILEIAEILFFLFVAMTYIEVLIYLKVFDSLKYKLISKEYSYKKLFYLTGLIAFFLSPIADNLTTALILATVLVTIENKNKQFLVPSAINIVVAANAGGVWSPFGDITTLMTWTAEKANFIDFLFLFPASISGYLLTAFLLSRFVPSDKPSFDSSKQLKPKMKVGAKGAILLGLITLLSAVISHQILGFPAMWGMMFGLTLLKIYSYILSRKYAFDQLNILQAMSKVEINTLLFFFGILSAVAALYFIGWLTLLSSVYKPDILGPTLSNILVGFLSAIVDNVPVMSAVLKANPSMDTSQWLLVTLTAGIGGSLISFGSAAGIGVMGKVKGIYTFNSHMKYAWTIILGYAASIAIWYLQFAFLNIHININ